MATMKDDYRKPGTMMWEWFVANANAGVQPDLGCVGGLHFWQVFG
jgi:hypothetical protein